MLTWFVMAVYGVVGVYWVLYACITDGQWFTKRVVDGVITGILDSFLETYLLFGALLVCLILALYTLAWPVVIPLELIWLRYTRYRERRRFTLSKDVRS